MAGLILLVGGALPAGKPRLVLLVPLENASGRSSSSFSGLFLLLDRRRARPWQNHRRERGLIGSASPHLHRSAAPAANAWRPFPGTSGCRSGGSGRGADLVGIQLLFGREQPVLGAVLSLLLVAVALAYVVWIGVSRHPILGSNLSGLDGASTNRSRCHWNRPRPHDVTLIHRGRVARTTAMSSGATSLVDGEYQRNELGAPLRIHYRSARGKRSR